MAGKFEAYTDKAGKYRFRLKASNGETILTSQGYASRSGRSNGIGNIDLLKDLTPAQLESLRLDSGGRLVLAVDVNEDASGTESSTSQGIALKSLTFTIGFSDGSSSAASRTLASAASRSPAWKARPPSL